MNPATIASSRRAPTSDSWLAAGARARAPYSRRSRIFSGSDHSVVLLSERPPEEKVSALQDELRRLTNGYYETRKLTRLTWRIQVLTEALDAILKLTTRRLSWTNMRLWFAFAPSIR